MRKAYVVLKDGLYKLNFILTNQQKVYGIITFVLSIIGAILETAGVGIVLPLVQMMLSADLFMDSSFLGVILCKFKISSYVGGVTFMVLLIMLLFLIKNMYFMFLSWIRTKYSTKIERELSVSMLQACMDQGYMYFVNESNAEIMKYISIDTSGTNQLVHNFLRAITDICIIIFISIYLLITDWIIAMGVIFMAGLCLLLVYGLFRNKMRKAGVEYNFYCGETNQYLLQCVMGIKEVLALKKQNYFITNYKDALTQRQNKYIQQNIGWEWPAYIIEGLCIVGILGVLCIKMMISPKSLNLMIPTLSAFAIGAFRILPSLGRISSALNAAVYYVPSLNHIYEHLRNDNIYKHVTNNIEEDDDKCAAIGFNEGLKLENIYWKYAEGEKDVLCGLNLTISKGTSVGIVGQSGSGKTTMADIILGLLKPQKGSVTIDGKSIYDEDVDISQVLGYVPQNSYFSNDSIRNNVAFGIYDKDIEDEKVWWALEQAQLKDVVEKLDGKLDTKMGDDGLHFSGGQRQRVAIARALYHDPDILIFDEATAALDTETEKAVMESIIELKKHKTLLIIAHRLTTIRECDFIYEIKNGKAVERSYEELVR